MDLTRRHFLKVGGGLAVASAFDLRLATGAGAATAPKVKVPVKQAIDITQAFAADGVFTPFVEPNYPNSIQSFAFNLGAEQVFVAQNAGSASDPTSKTGANLGFTRYKRTSTAVTSTDVLPHAGHGAQIGIDHSATGSYLWTGCTAVPPSAGSAGYGRSSQIGRFSFDTAHTGGAAEANRVTTPDVEIYSPVHNAHDFSTAVDARNRYLQVKYNLGYSTYFALYSLDHIIPGRGFPAPIAKLHAPGNTWQQIAGHASYGNWHYDVQQTKAQRASRTFLLRRTDYNTGRTVAVVATIPLNVAHLEIEGLAIHVDGTGQQSLFVGVSRPVAHTWALYGIPGPAPLV